MQIIKILDDPNNTNFYENMMRTYRENQQLLKQDNILNNISDIGKKLDTIGKTIDDFGKTITTLFDYLNHPEKLLKVIWKYIVDYGYWICIIICITGIIFYICGEKKGLKWSKLSFVSYLLIQAINTGLGL